MVLVGLVPSSFISNFNVLGAMSVIQTIDVGDLPRYIIFNPHNDDIYVSNQDSNDVSVIDSDTNTVIDTIAVGDGPRDILYNPNNSYVYIVNGYSDNVSVIKEKQSVNDPPKYLSELIKNIVKNPLDITNSIKSANEIVNILTDNDRGNDNIACDLLEQQSYEQFKNIQHILRC
jgi:YVTN family beta-propeller protein